MLKQNGEKKISLSYDNKGQLINNTKEKSTTVLNLTYPLFKGWGSIKLNLYCSRFAAALKAYCKNKIALKVEKDRPPVIIDMRYLVFFNEDSLSLCFDVSHGRNLPYRFTSVWSLKSGFPLSLYKVTGLSKKELIKQLVLKTEERMSRGFRIYYGDYKKLISRHLFRDNWYLDEKGVCVFFQPGDIAPVIEGMQIFNVAMPTLPLSSPKTKLQLKRH